MQSLVSVKSAESFKNKLDAFRPIRRCDADARPAEQSDNVDAALIWIVVTVNEVEKLIASALLTLRVVHTQGDVKLHVTCSKPHTLTSPLAVWCIQRGR